MGVEEVGFDGFDAVGFEILLGGGGRKARDGDDATALAQGVEAATDHAREAWAHFSGGTEDDEVAVELIQRREDGVGGCRKQFFQVGHVANCLGYFFAAAHHSPGVAVLRSYRSTDSSTPNCRSLMRRRARKLFCISLALFASLRLLSPAMAEPAVVSHVSVLSDKTEDVSSLETLD